MKVNQMRIVMDKIQRMQVVKEDKDVKWPITVSIRLNFGKALRYVTLNVTNFIGDGELHADYEGKLLTIKYHKETPSLIYIPFESIGLIEVRFYESDDKKLYK